MDMVNFYLAKWLGRATGQSGRHVMAILHKAVADVHSCNSDLEALYKRWFLHPLYREAFYKRLTRESAFRDSLNALRAEVAQQILRVHEASADDVRWRDCYCCWEIPEPCHTLLEAFAAQWKLPRITLGDILGNLLRAIDLHINEQVSLEPAIWNKPLSVWGKEVADLEDLSEKTSVAISFFEVVEADIILKKKKALNPRTRESLISFAKARLVLRSLQKIFRDSGISARLPYLSFLEPKWREKIQTLMSATDTPIELPMRAEFMELEEVVEALKRVRPILHKKMAPLLAEGLPERSAEAFYLRAYRGWSWSQIANAIQVNYPEFTVAQARNGVKRMHLLLYGGQESFHASPQKAC